MIMYIMVGISMRVFVMIVMMIMCHWSVLFTVWQYVQAYPPLEPRDVDQLRHKILAV